MCFRLCSAEDVEAIEALYERALRDFLSVPLWASYIEVRRREGGQREGGGTRRALQLGADEAHVRAHASSSRAQFLRASGTPTDKLRAVCERALTAGGLHFWQARFSAHNLLARD